MSSAIKSVNPVYPAIAKAANVSGAVSVEIVINEQGIVSSARAVSGHPLLQSAAVEAARQWEFPPTTLSGEPVRVIGTITFNFQP
jgi:protein TonB